MEENKPVTETANDKTKRDSGLVVLLYEKECGQDFKEFDSKKSAMAFIQTLGGPSKVVKLYVGAKERKVETNISYTF